ncbi:hypothetical protein [Nocardioides currus]|uniref:DUF4439 domain-containing protein n=1 Tax=Nocardioides currus TaxID=2133958 RepID=A0A2R7YXA2_9ACTN|nr:hypothetical protein [Nocardioides currus]PUA80686.1 hypothetical protein C7S10_13115 [Nocardioides currus]
MSSPRAQTSRRTALALAVSAPLALAACDLDPPARSASGSSSGSPTATPSAAAPLPDADVVEGARAATLLAVALIEAAQARHGLRRSGLEDLLRLHAAHLAVLDDGSPEPEVEAPLVAATPARARAQVAASENGLTATLADAAGQAASGDLARALASMSAALRQRVAV